MEEAISMLERDVLTIKSENKSENAFSYITPTQKASILKEVRSGDIGHVIHPKQVEVDVSDIREIGQSVDKYLKSTV